MKFAVIGAGFSGLALAYFLSRDNHHVTVIDKKGIGGGASGIAAGLLHPYVGFKCRLNWRGREALQASRQLIETVAPNSFREGIVRIAASHEQDTLFQEAAALHEDLSMISFDHPGLAAKKALFIQSGLTVDGPYYLRSLWKAIEAKGGQLLCDDVLELDHLASFDRVVVCSGQLARKLFSLPLHFIKGQLLKLKWPRALPPLTHSLIGKKYVVMEKDQTSCWVGATYERGVVDDQPDFAAAKDDLLAGLSSMIPELAESEVLDIQAGIRAFAPDKRPFFQQIDTRIWTLTGMGSKGLLYHALLAEELAGSCLQSVEKKT